MQVSVQGRRRSPTVVGKRDRRREGVNARGTCRLEMRKGLRQRWRQGQRRAADQRRCAGAQAAVIRVNGLRVIAWV